MGRKEIDRTVVKAMIQQESARLEVMIKRYDRLARIVGKHSRIPGDVRLVHSAVGFSQRARDDLELAGRRVGNPGEPSPQPAELLDANAACDRVHEEFPSP